LAPTGLRDSTVTAYLAIIATGVVVALLREASSVFAPLALAIFIIALVSPLQEALKARLPATAATALTVVATIAVCAAFTWLAAWGFGRVAAALVADAARLQAVYDTAVAWLEEQGLSVTGFFSEHFSVRWFIGAAQQVTGRVNTALGFWLITFVYVIIGLIELDDATARARRLPEPAASVVIAGSRSMGAKFRRYMVVRTQMSLITGILVWLFTWSIGLPFSAEWGVSAFTLN
jgi:AI-2 transport protein TqsA